MWTVISASTSTAKVRLATALTFLFFLVAMVGQSFAILPVENNAKQCRMQSMQHAPEQAAHKCKHEAPKMPCCPMPVSQNTLPQECMTRGECCQVSEDSTRSSRCDALANRTNQSDEAPIGQVATAQRSAPRSNTHTWVEVRLRHTRPVFDLKTDLRI